MQQRGYKKALSEETLSRNVKETSYAVRGAIPLRGAEIQRAMAAGEKFPFDATYECNIGNPQAVGQSPMTFNREVIAGMMHPELLKTNAISDSAKARVKEVLADLPSPMGAYAGDSRGHARYRKLVAEFITKRD